MTTAFTAMPEKITTSTMRFLEDMMAGTYANDGRLSIGRLAQKGQMSDFFPLIPTFSPGGRRGFLCGAAREMV